MEKNLVCGTMVWPLAHWVKNLLEKNDPVCETVGMASGGLIGGFLWTLHYLSFLF